MLAPYERLRDELGWLRDGDLYHGPGLQFHAAWERALARVCRDTADAAWWREVFESQRPVWRRAYLRMAPTPMDDLLAELIADLGLATVRERRCGFCGESLEGRRPNVLFCNSTHRRRAEWRRESALKARNGGPTGGFKLPVGALA